MLHDVYPLGGDHAVCLYEKMLKLARSRMSRKTETRNYYSTANLDGSTTLYLLGPAEGASDSRARRQRRRRRRAAP
jgi:hypothetical protein